ncbi:peptidylprolyl isomerase [Dehalococcoidia bacterium]|nr:peptidylprolyl isomerase [Dehalococcoidia bacterium]
MVDDAQETRLTRPVVDARRKAAERPEAQRRRQRLAGIIIGALFLIIVGIIVAGYLIIFVLPPRQLIMRVNDVTITRGEMVKLLRLRQATAQATGAPYSAGTDAFEVLQVIMEGEIIAQAAPRYGITATNQDIDDRVRIMMAPSEFDSVGKDDAQIEREFHERYRGYLNATQVDEADHRDLVRKAILREKFRLFVSDRVPLTAEQVHVHRISMTSEGEIDIMQTKLADVIGDDLSTENIQFAFAYVAREFSTNPQTAQSGGDLGWLPLGVDKDYERAFFGLKVGELSQPIPIRQDPNTMYFFMVSERSGTREVDPYNLEVLKTNALQEWINEERANHEIFSEFNSEIYAWMTEQLLISYRAAPTPVAGRSIPGL